MADGTQPPGSDMPSPRRGGWQLPDLPGSPQAAPSRRRDPGAREPQQPVPPGSAPGPHGGGPRAGAFGTAVLAGGVAGEVRNISEGTVQRNNVPITVVTFRLERHDPSGGRTSVVMVRLRGSRAIGFASEGDWVEALGQSSQGFINVRRAVNRTSGAEYQAAGNRLNKAGLAVGYILFIGFILAIATWIVIGG